MKIEFETIESNQSFFINRAKVPGGWLVTASEHVVEGPDLDCVTGLQWRTSITFVPDPEHAWGSDTPEGET